MRGGLPRGVRRAICDDVVMGDAADPRERLRAAVRLADLIGETCVLADDHGLLRAACPAHPDWSNSLHVARDGSFYHCFSCGRHGDAVRWTMDREGVDGSRAFSLLATWMANDEVLSSRADFYRQATLPAECGRSDPAPLVRRSF